MECSCSYSEEEEDGRAKKRAQIVFEMGYDGVRLKKNNHPIQPNINTSTFIGFPIRSVEFSMKYSKSSTEWTSEREIKISCNLN